MTRASDGLRRSLARGSVAALSEMQADDILSHLNADQKAALKGALAAAEAPSGAADDGNPETNTMTEPTSGDAIAQAVANATAAANQRYATVLASEHYAGREQLAQALLGNDKMSADDIVAALAAAPAPAAAAAPQTPEQLAETAEAAARAEMQAALAETANSNVTAGDTPNQPDAKAQSDAVWEKAYGLKEGVK